MSIIILNGVHEHTHSSLPGRYETIPTAHVCYASMTHFCLSGNWSFLCKIGVQDVQIKWCLSTTQKHVQLLLPLLLPNKLDNSSHVQIIYSG